MKLILDTNLLVSALLGKSLRDHLENVVAEPDIRLLVSRESLGEFQEVMRRPKFSRYVAEAQVQAYLDFLQQKFEFVEVVSQVDACRDSGDDFLLALAQDGKADYLITGDKDLLTLGTFGETRVVTLTAFLQILTG